MSHRHWSGGFYELALQVGPRDEERVAAWVAAVVEEVGLTCLTVVDGLGPVRAATDDDAVGGAGEALCRGAHLRGVVRLPRGAEASCGLLLLQGAPDDGTRASDPGSDAAGPDWLVLYLPLAGLGAAGVEVDGFPFDDRSGTESLAWRRPLDEWLAGVARAVRSTVPFGRAVIGFEVAGDDDGPVEPSGLAPAAPRDRAHLVGGPAGLTYLAAER